MNKFFILFFFILLNLSPIHSGAQVVLPESGELYRGDVVPEIRIYISPDTLEWLYKPENLLSDRYFRANVIFDNGTVKDEFANVGFRIRGNTSRYAQKKSFRLSFNTFESGRSYYGVEKMNLNGEANDPSSIRSIACFEIYRQANLIASRANHCILYINDNYHGVYSNVEHYDEEFTNLHFGTKAGNLYKCYYGASLVYYGEDQETYKITDGRRRIYDLNNQSGIDDYSDLINFIRVLNLTPDEDFICEFEKIFELNDYLKYMAIDILIGNWDGPLYNMNNYYLYNNPTTGKFHYLPYDLDNTFGIDWVGQTWINRNIYNWSHENEPRPLYDRLMQIPEIKDRYSFYLKELTNAIYTNGNLSSFLFSKRSLIENWIEIDPFKSLDFGFTYNDFRQSLFEGRGGHVKVGILPFIDGRRSSARNQIQLNKIGPMVDQGRLDYINSGKNIHSKVRVQSDVGITSVQLNYRLKGEEEWTSIPLVTNSIPNDFLKFNFFYEYEIVEFPVEGEYEYYFEALDVEGDRGYYPHCEFKSFTYQKLEYTLAINEFMASNGNIIADEHGDYDDWIEIYNYGAEPVSLSGLYLSDRINNPSKWAFPDYTMEAGEYIIIWADGETNQGMFHASFSLSIDGEDLILSFKDSEGGFISIDELTFSEQERNISYGRFPNAIGPMGFMNPTPGAENTSLINSNDYLSANSYFKVYPNPIQGSMNIESLGNIGISRVEIISNEGHRIFIQDFRIDQNMINLTGLNFPSGNYYLIINEKFVQKILKN